ncbi:ABC transporter permease [Bacillus sp. Marseille-P3661]|uniref:ABC transporter permease n=1 Tax=Bacillus sp. Marseille-P3661 TaxID=1936234 RepID=UPI000C8446A0|nr:ABC transporter permease subunit [Bacillus sp. Marseille-P3661]
MKHDFVYKIDHKDTHHIHHPFLTMVQKEIADQVRSWRFIILVLLILLTCLASLYSSLSIIRTAAASIDTNDAFLFLKIFTLSDPQGSMPSFMTFISLLGPLLGIGLGFDAINSERNRGTLSRILAQPIPRDYLINAKFLANLGLIGILTFALGFLIIGLGIISIGFPPTWDEFWRMVAFLFLSVIYIGFWLNISILFSIRFKQTATSALSSIAMWLFFSVFYSIIINIIGKAAFQIQKMGAIYELGGMQTIIQTLSRFNPSYLYSEITTILLTPTIRSLGPLTMEQLVGAIPSPLPLKQSLLLIWPQFTGLIAATIICFGISYFIFMKQEIRAK